MRQRPWLCVFFSAVGPLLAVLVVAAFAPRAWAQDRESEGKSGVEALRPVEPLPSEVLPQVFHFKDDDGKSLQVVPGLTYAQLMELFKRDWQLAGENQRPSYSIQHAELSGNAAGTSAELLAKFTIAVHQEGWVGVPLRLNSAVLLERATCEGPGDHVVNVDPEGQGHVVWIRGDVEGTHEVTLKLLARVEQVGTQSRMQLTMPRAAVSRLQLQVPLEGAAATVSEGSVLASIRPLAGGRTELKAAGLGGEFEIAWYPAEANVAAAQSIEATGKQTIRMNGQEIHTEARLTVRSLGGEFDRFQVRLPPGADHVGIPQAGVTVVAVDAAAPEGKLYDVKLDKKTIGPVEVRLITERTHNAAENDEMLQLAGFEVPGAVRQGGTIAVHVAGNWQVVWGESTHVRSADGVAEDVRRDELAAEFEYFVQPYSLMARVVEQTTRIRVEPEYVLLVGSDEARLLARLKYTIRGAKVRTLGVDLSGWEVDSVGPANLIGVDPAVAQPEEALTIPLLQPTSGELELTFEAHQKIAPAAAGIALELPQPRGDTVAANVAVLGDDNVELIPRLEDAASLAPLSVRPTMKVPQRQQDPLFYRTTGTNARFEADVKVHEQSITAALRATLAVGDGETQIDESLVFQVAYQPTDHFTLKVPRQVRPEGLTVLHEGRSIDPLPIRARIDHDDEFTPLRVNLPQPVIGRCELVVQYAVRHEAPPDQASTRITVPLVLPLEGQLSDNQLSIASQPGLAVRYPPAGPWSVENASDSEGSTSDLTLTARKAIDEVNLVISSEQGPSEVLTTFERGLFQTHLTAASRHDRALFRVATNQLQLQISLPEGAVMRSLWLGVDGVQVTPLSTQQRTVTIPIVGGPGEHVLDIRYRFEGRAPRGELALEAPQLPATSWVRQLYWQITLPENVHVLLAPENYAEELTWTWSDFYWQRKPRLAPEELENWIGAGPAGAAARGLTDARPPAAASANRYLFSTVGSIEPLSVYTMSRSRLVLLASLTLLLVGLLLIYVPAARHPAALFGLAVVVAGASLVAPRASLLLAQASALGLLLAGLAMLLARWLPRPAPAAVAVRGSSYVAVERSVTEMYQRPPAGGSHPPSTATEPFVSSSPEVPS